LPSDKPSVGGKMNHYFKKAAEVPDPTSKKILTAQGKGFDEGLRHREGEFRELQARFAILEQEFHKQKKAMLVFEKSMVTEILNE